MVNKSSGKYGEIKCFGSVNTEDEAQILFHTAQQWIHTYGSQQELDFDDKKGRELEETQRVINNMDAVLINGTQLLLERIYDEIGFNQIPDKILRHPIIARVSQPAGKLATIEYLKSYYDEDIDPNNIYRYMDKLYNTC